MADPRPPLPVHLESGEQIAKEAIGSKPVVHRPRTRNKPKLSQLKRVVDDMREDVRELTDDRLADLLRRAEQAAEADGYPPSSRGGSGGSGGHADPTLAAVEYRQDSQRRDVIGSKLAELVSSMYECRAQLRRINRLRVSIVNSGALIKDVDTTVQSRCECCGHPATGDRNDRIIAGYGNACVCYPDWNRWRNDERAAGREPTKVRFEVEHQTKHGDQCVTVGESDGFYTVDDIEALRANGTLPTQPAREA